MKMKAPPACRQVSHMGRVYRVDADGLVEGPEDARAELEAHGFGPAAERRRAPQPRSRKERE